MNLVRLGHLHTPTGPNDEGYCQTALVCGVDNSGDAEVVHLAVWTHAGSPLGVPVTSIPVSPPAESDRTFHLSAECPFGR